MSEKHRNSQYQDEIAVRDLILLARDYLLEILRSWKIIVFTVIISTLLFLISSIRSNPKYGSELSFMINEDETTSIGGGIGSLIGNFGLGNLGGSFNLDKILSLSQSRRITKDALLQQEMIDGHTDYLANHFINYLDTLDLWEYQAWYSKPFLEQSDIKNFRYEDVELDSLDKREQKAFNKLHKVLCGYDGERGVLSSEYGEKNGIMKLSLWLYHEEVAYHIVHNLFNSLSIYYVDKNVEKQKYTYDVLKVKADSIFSDLRSAEYQLASFSDANRNLYSTKDKVTQLRLNREVQKLSILYGEVVKNLELADFSLKNKTPFIQVIDEPSYPLRKSQLSPITAIIYGIFLGGLISVGYVVARKMWRSIFPKHSKVYKNE